MICVHCGHRLAWVPQKLGPTAAELRVVDELITPGRPSCVPWWNHEVFNVDNAARQIIQAMNEDPRS